MNMGSTGILDVSFLKSSLSDEARKALQTMPVLVIQDFYMEAEVLSSLFEPDSRMRIREDLRFIREVIDPECIPDYMDVWELILDEAGRNNGITVFTADRFLKDRIRAYGIRCGIYELDGAGDEAENREQKMEVPLGDPRFYPGRKDCYYVDSCQKVVLADCIRQDGETCLFRVENRRDLLAKIYCGDRLTPAVLKKIRSLMRMNRRMEADWLEMPAAILYSDHTCRYPVGYLEKSIQMPASDRRLYPEGLGIDPAYESLMEAYRKCIGLTKQLYYMRFFGLYGSDTDPDRRLPFRFDEDETLFVWMDPERMFAPGPGQEGDTVDWYFEVNRRLYACLFYILSGGDYPLDSMGRFRFWGYDCSYEKRTLFGDALWQIFESAFEGKSDFSAGRILLGLIEAYDKLKWSQRKMEWRDDPMPVREYKDFGQRDACVDGLPGNAAGILPADVSSGPDKGKMRAKQIGIIAGIGVLLLTLTVGGTFLIRKNLGMDRLPDCIGMNQDDTGFKDVLVRLGDEGISHRAEAVYADTMNIGEIVGQRPGSMEYDDIRECVVFEVSKGIDFRGWKEADALQELEEEGWEAQCEKGSSLRYPIGTVFDMEYPDADGKKILLKINETPFGEDEIADRGIQASVCEEEQTVRVNEKVTITVRFSGEIPAQCDTNAVTFDSSIVQIVSCDKQSGDENSLVLNYTLLGKGEGKGYVRFYLEDGGRIAGARCYISVEG